MRYPACLRRAGRRAQRGAGAETDAWDRRRRRRCPRLEATAREPARRQREGGEDVRRSPNAALLSYPLPPWLVGHGRRLQCRVAGRRRGRGPSAEPARSCAVPLRGKCSDGRGDPVIDVSMPGSVRRRCSRGSGRRRSAYDPRSVDRGDLTHTASTPPSGRVQRDATRGCLPRPGSSAPPWLPGCKTRPAGRDATSGRLRVLDVGCGVKPLYLFAPYADAYVGVDIVDNPAADLRGGSRSCRSRTRASTSSSARRCLEHSDDPARAVAESPRHSTRRAGARVDARRAGVRPLSSDDWRWTHEACAASSGTTPTGRSLQ